jgi:membrane protein
MLQQQHAWLAVPVAVWKKFGDDQAGNLAALVAYYAFASLFPLLLVLFSVLGIVLHNNPSLQHQLVNSALAQYPVIGSQLKSNIGTMHGSGLALVIGLLGTFIGARSVAFAMQNALNSVWEIPITRRPGFPWSWLRSFGLILVIGLGLIGTTVLSGLAARAAGSGATDEGRCGGREPDGAEARHREGRRSGHRRSEGSLEDRCRRRREDHPGRDHLR